MGELNSPDGNGIGFITHLFFPRLGSGFEGPVQDKVRGFLGFTRSGYEHLGIILQGLCSMAFCQNAVIDNCCKDRNPALLKRLAVRFAKPVLPKDELTITGFEMPGAPAGTIGFEAKRPDGTAVVKNGIAEIG